MPNTPNVEIPYVPEGTLDPAAGLNDSLNVIDALLQPRVISIDLYEPPATGADGDMYIVAAGASGDWAGKDDWLARYVLEGQFWQFYEPGVQVQTVVNDEDGIFYVYDTVNSPIGWKQVEAVAVSTPIVVQLACSDMTTAITSGTSKAYFRAARAMTLRSGNTGVRASLATASASSGPFTIDINVNGSTILSTKLTIDDTEKTSLTAATAVVISNVDIAEDDEVTIDVDDEGSGAKGLIVTLIGDPP